MHIDLGDRTLSNKEIIAEIDNILERQADYNKLTDTITRSMTERVVTLLLPEKIDKEKESFIVRINNRIESDELFKENYEIMTRSVAIYAQKYPPRNNPANQETFNNLTKGIGKALELNLADTLERYHNDRISKSKPQFDRVFEDVESNTRQRIEAVWQNLSQSVASRLDATSTDDLERIKKKLAAVRDVFKTQVVVHLKDLFVEKFAELESKATKPDAKLQLRERYEMLKTTLFKSSGELREDILDIYKEIHRVTLRHKKQMQDTQSVQEKAEIGKRAAVPKAIDKILRGVLKLSSIDPNGVDRNTNYAVVISQIAETFAADLAKLEIISKDKDSLQKKQKKKIASSNETTPENGHGIEIEIIENLEQIKNIIKEQGAPQIIDTATTTRVDFNSLARAPELTTSCQRLTEQTSHNHAAYSRLIDGINQMIETQRIEGKQPKGRIARCFIELAKAKIGTNGEKPKKDQSPSITVLLDREYYDATLAEFKNDFIASSIKLTCERFSQTPEVKLLLSPNQFRDSIETVKKVAEQNGYMFSEQQCEYFINESDLKLFEGKYYDSFGGANDTRTPHYKEVGMMYVLEKKK